MKLYYDMVLEALPEAEGFQVLGSEEQKELSYLPPLMLKKEGCDGHVVLVSKEVVEGAIEGMLWGPRKEGSSDSAIGTPSYGGKDSLPSAAKGIRTSTSEAAAKGIRTPTSEAAPTQASEWSLPSNALFILTSPALKEEFELLMKKSPSGLFFLPDREWDPDELMARLIRLYDSIDNWQEKLSSASYDLAGVKEMLEISSDFMNGDFMLVDISYNIPVYTKKYQNLQSLLTREDSGRMTEDALFNLASDPVIADIRSLRGVHFYENVHDKIPGSGPLFCNMFREGEDIYYNRLLFLRPDSRYSKTDYRLVKLLSDRIEKITRHLSTFSIPQSLRDGLRSLILHSIHGDDEEEFLSLAPSVLLRAGWRMSDSYRLYLFSSLYLKRDDGITDYIITKLEQIIPYSCAIHDETNIILVQNTSHTDYSFGELRPHLAEFLRENVYKASLSMEIHSFSQLNCAYKQAEAAFRLGSQSEPMHWYYLFEDYILDYILQKCVEDIPADMLRLPQLDKLIEYDKSHNTQLVETLRVLARENFNVTHAAQKLYIHRTSFQDRLNRIKGLTELDLENADVRFLLMLGFRLT